MAAHRKDAMKDTEITGLTCDSRRVQPGFLFAALPGSSVDGRAYISDALTRGAAAILAPDDTSCDDLDISVPILKDVEPRQGYAKLAANFFGHQPKTIVAVTGTNGKTSVAEFTRQLWASQGLRAASLGTIGLTAPGFDAGPGLTTPDAADLHQMLADLTDAGIDHLAIEASSHGLDQFRLDGVKLSAAAFTNLSRDHLDYHGTLEHYFDAKARLFSDLIEEGGAAILNADSDRFPALSNILAARSIRVIDYGHQAQAIKLLACQPTATGQIIAITVGDTEFKCRLPLVGAFQVSNALAALGLFIATGGALQAGIAGLSVLQGAPGRMQHMGQTKTGGHVYVDYAHTPDALKNALKALRVHTTGKLHVVFGCGGDRDSGKRPQMGAIATKYADHVIITDDNPRSEDATQIRNDILRASPNADEIGDRAEAIIQAVKCLDQGDALIIAGKGHEKGQIIGKTVHPFDDRALALRLIEGAE